MLAGITLTLLCLSDAEFQIAADVSTSVFARAPGFLSQTSGCGRKEIQAGVVNFDETSYLFTVIFCEVKFSKVHYA